MAYVNNEVTLGTNTQAGYPMAEPADQKRGGVEIEIDRQRDHLTTLEQAVAALSERIFPALRPSNPTPVGGNAMEGGISPVAASVQESNVRIRAVSERIADLIQRVDL